MVASDSCYHRCILYVCCIPSEPFVPQILMILHIIYFRMLWDSKTGLLLILVRFFNIFWAVSKDSFNACLSSVHREPIRRDLSLSKAEIVQLNSHLLPTLFLSIIRK